MRARSLMRERVYDRELSRGIVLCYVCRKPVPRRAATLEHVVPLSLGGGDGWNNLAISHRRCNSTRGNKPIAHLVEQK